MAFQSNEETAPLLLLEQASLAGNQEAGEPPAQYCFYLLNLHPAFPPNGAHGPFRQDIQ